MYLLLARNQGELEYAEELDKSIKNFCQNISKYLSWLIAVSPWRMVVARSWATRSYGNQQLRLSGRIEQMKEVFSFPICITGRCTRCAWKIVCVCILMPGNGGATTSRVGQWKCQCVWCLRTWGKAIVTRANQVHPQSGFSCITWLRRQLWYGTDKVLTRPFPPSALVMQNLPVHDTCM